MTEYKSYKELVEGPAKPFAFVSGDSLWRSQKQADWLVKGIIESGTHGMLFGDPESGKTLVLFDLLLSVAMGMKWRGNKVKQGAVFYLCGEGGGGLGRRIGAWRAEHNIHPDVEIPFYTSVLPAEMLDASSALSVCNAIRQMSEVLEVTPVAIGIDTLARNFGGGDENSAKDVGLFVRNVDEYLIHKLGCAVITSHHTGHGTKDRARGSMSLPGALDVFYQVQKEGEEIAVICKKSKDFEKPANMKMRLMVHELGYEDEDGDPVTGATVRYDPEHKYTIKPGKQMSKAATMCYDELCRLYEDERAHLNAKGQGHVEVRIEINYWRRRCTAKRAGPGIEVGTPKWETASRYVYKATRAMIDNNQVTMSQFGPFVLPTGCT